MWPRRYFGAHYFAPFYWSQSQGSVIPVGGSFVIVVGIDPGRIVWGIQ